jgi:hypothetical protein
MSSFFDYIVVICRTNFHSKNEKGECGFLFHPDVKKKLSSKRKKLGIEDESEDIAAYFSGNSKKERLALTIKGIYWIALKTGQPRFVSWREIKEGKKFEKEKQGGDMFTTLLMESFASDLPSLKPNELQSLQKLIEEVLVVYTSSQQNIAMINRNLMKPAAHMSHNKDASPSKDKDLRDRSISNPNRLKTSVSSSSLQNISSPTLEPDSDNVALNIKFPDGFPIQTGKKFWLQMQFE